MTRQEAIDTLDPVMDDFMACVFFNNKEIKALNFAIADMKRRELESRPIEGSTHGRVIEGYAVWSTEREEFFEGFLREDRESAEEQAFDLCMRHRQLDSDGNYIDNDKLLFTVLKVTAVEIER